MRIHTKYICQQCGFEATGWLGKCPQCGTWGSLVETLEEVGKRKGGSEKRTTTKDFINLSSIEAKKTKRILTGISELDRVLGGGLVEGQVVLVAGEPGIGKSTLLLEVARNLDKLGTIYISGEESSHQIKIRADRLGIKSSEIRVLEETDIDIIISSLEKVLEGDKKPGLVVVDSIQTMTTSDLNGLAGSVGQVRECTFRLVRFAKEKNIPVFIVGHITKEGTVAGPAVLMHIVDSVLWFEGDRTFTTRLLRAVKNRFGPTDEVGVFSMEDKGLISMNNPEKVFLTSLRKSVTGNVVSSILEGTRPIFVEIQTLVVPSKLAIPRRVAQGFDFKRFELLLAVLTRRCGLPLYENDCYLNIAGGLSIKDPSADLAICLSVASSYFDKPLPKGAFVIGEVGLLGEVREVVAEEKRVKEAGRLGFNIPITSKGVDFLQKAIREYLK